MLRKSKYKDLEKYKKTKREQQKRYYDKTQDALNSRKCWTPREIKIIMAKNMSDRELSRILGRSMKAIEVKRSKIKHGNN